MRRFVSRFRLIIALLLLALLFYFVDFRELLRALSNIRLIYIVYLALLSVVLIWLSCLKWQMFVRAAGHETRVLQLMKYYTMSYFFNMFLPSSLGGDVARSVQLGHHLKSHKSVFAATFVERYTGFLAMNLIGVMFVALGARATAGVEYAILSVAFLTTLAGLVAFSESLSSWSFSLFTRTLAFFGLGRTAAKLDSSFQKILAATAFARDDFPLFVKAMALSLAFHFFAVVNTYVAALAVGWHNAQFGGLCIVVPLVLLVSVAPITPSSVGVQEGAFLYLLTKIGATHAQGLGVGVVLRLKNIVTACVGGLLYLYSSGMKHEDNV